MEQNKPIKLKANYMYAWLSSFVMAAVCLFAIIFPYFLHMYNKSDMVSELIWIALMLAAAMLEMVDGCNNYRIAYVYSDRICIKSLIGREKTLYWSHVSVVCIRSLPTYSSRGCAFIYKKWIVLCRAGQSTDYIDLRKNKYDYFALPYSDKTVVALQEVLPRVVFDSISR